MDGSRGPLFLERAVLAKSALPNRWFWRQEAPERVVLAARGKLAQAQSRPVQAQSRTVRAQSRPVQTQKLIQARSKPVQAQSRPPKPQNRPVTIDLPFTYQCWDDFCVSAAKTRSPRVNFCENLTEAGSQKCTVCESLENMSKGLFGPSKTEPLKVRKANPK